MERKKNYRFVPPMGYDPNLNMKNDHLLFIVY